MGQEYLVVDHGYKVLIDGTILDPKGRVVPPTKLGPPGYMGVYIPEERIQLYLHRVVAHVHVHNPRPDIFHCVDHIDRNPANNHASNLRWVNRILNGLNNDTKGCSYHKIWKKWQSVVRGKTLGYYKTEEEATAVSKKYRKNLFETLYTNYLAAACTITRDLCSTSFAETARYPTLAC